MNLSEGQNLTLNSDLRGYLSTFQAANTFKTAPFRTRNNAQLTSKQLQNNIQKVEKTGFLTLEMVKMTISKGHKLNLKIRY